MTDQSLRGEFVFSIPDNKIFPYCDGCGDRQQDNGKRQKPADDVRPHVQNLRGSTRPNKYLVLHRQSPKCVYRTPIEFDVRRYYRQCENNQSTTLGSTSPTTRVCP